MATIWATLTLSSSTIQYIKPEVVVKVPTTNAEVVDFAREALKGTPLMEVAKCESSMKHWEEDGTTVRFGRVVAEDRGFLQINSRYHRKDALKLGFDIEDPIGNIRYGLWLYSKKGLDPWEASHKCWQALLAEAV